jgi:hypothetical protein
MAEIENDNPLLQAIRAGDYTLVKSILNDAPLLLRIQTPSELPEFKPSLMLGSSTANMNPLQYALAHDDEGELSKIVDLLVSVYLLFLTKAIKP